MKVHACIPKRNCRVREDDLCVNCRRCHLDILHKPYSAPGDRWHVTFLAICDGKPKWLDTYLRSVYVSWDMYRTTHDQSLQFHLRKLITSLLVSALPVPLEIVQCRFSSMCNAWMGTWSCTLLYQTLAWSHLHNMEMMLDLFIPGDFLMMCCCFHHIRMVQMAFSVCRL